METSNPLPAVQTTSPSLPTAPPSFVQTELATSASPPVSAVTHLQQLNIQQSLLLQQYAISQQALSQQTLSKAVKSPAEIAAARAAEISKQLGASEKKTSERSKSRSTSKSPSHSRSLSTSRSPSRSPIKYRRGRSRSLSPIRYRRDYYSSYRPRDYYGYRGHNYRSYYRGSYNDYSRYRYGRDYDYHYRRRSRSRERRWSRTRSRSPRRDRSRGRKRSPTLSPPMKKRSQTISPRDSRKGSVSPPVKREKSRSQHTSQQSLSRETVRSPSVSRGSVNVSPARSSSSESQEKSVSNHIVEKSPLTELSEEPDKTQTAESLKRTKKESSVTRQGRRESSSSPTRSHSVSLGDDKYTNASNRVTVKKRHETPEGDSSDEHDDVLNSHGKKFMSEAEDFAVRKNYSGHAHKDRKLTRSSDAISDDDGQSEESMDDWRHDLKKVVKEKAISAKEGDDNRAEGKAKTKLFETQLAERGSSLTVNENNSDFKQGLVVHSANFVSHNDSMMVVEELHAVSAEGHENVVISDDKSIEQVPILEEQKEMSDVDDDSERLVVEDLIFEGPQPASVAHEERKQRFEEGLNFDAQFGDADAVKVPDPTSDKKKAKKTSTAGDDYGYVRHLDGQVFCYEDKVRGRSRSRDRKKKRGAGLTKHESRKSKYKSHRRRHKHESMDEDSEEPRKRHKRKHRRESDHVHKERKKRRHKHRSRLSSAEDSSSEGEIEVRNSSGMKKKSSKKRRASKRDVSESITSSASLG